jgi:hypothetical protein
LQFSEAPAGSRAHNTRPRSRVGLVRRQIQ